MPIPCRTVVYSLTVSVVLFVVAGRLGNYKHGLGKHHPAVANVGEVTFASFLFSAGVFIALIVVFAAQKVLVPERHE